MRDLRTMIGVVKQFIPSTEDFEKVHMELTKIQGGLLYTPPECMGEKWVEAAQVLSILGQPTKNSPLWLRTIGIIWLNLQAEDSKLWP